MDKSWKVCLLMQKDKSVFITVMRNNDECIIYLIYF